MFVLMYWFDTNLYNDLSSKDEDECDEEEDLVILMMMESKKTSRQNIGVLSLALR